jgi:hypothetical protein
MKHLLVNNSLAYFSFNLFYVRNLLRGCARDLPSTG